MDSKMFIVILVVFAAKIVISVTNDEKIDKFNFNLQKLDTDERNKIFSYCDKNKDNVLNSEEYDTLLKSLFIANDAEKSSHYLSSDNKKDLFKLMDFDHNGKINVIEFGIIWDKWIMVILRPKSALIVVDVQNDFIDGSFALKNGHDVIPVINKLTENNVFDLIVYTKDWHPKNHCSFYNNVGLRNVLTLNGKSVNAKNVHPHQYDTVTFDKYPNISQKLWVEHCVQNTKGAQLHPELNIAKNSIVILKGTDPDIDSYSAFFDNGHIHETDLNAKLKKYQITDVYTSGVAYDFCVGLTTNDSLTLGYRTALIEDAARGTDIHSIKEMRNSLINRHAIIVNSDSVKSMVEAKDRKPEMGIVLANKLFAKL